MRYVTFYFFVFSLTLLTFFHHPIATASGKGSLQAQIPNINLDEVDPKIKDQCNTEAVNASGYDPNDPNNPTKSDYQKQHLEAMAQGLAEEVLFSHHKSIYRMRQRDREDDMKSSLKAQSDRAQGYVKAYRSCLESNLQNH